MKERDVAIYEATSPLKKVGFMDQTFIQYENTYLVVGLKQ